MKAEFRIGTAADIDSLVQFWNEHGGWDVIEREEWERRFFHTPLGPCPVVLACHKDTGALLAHFIFIPSLIHCNGRVLKALRPFAPVVSKEIRSALGLLTLVEYILKMYNYAVHHFSAQDIALFYMLPDPRWSKAFQVLPNIQMAKFPLWSVKLNGERRMDLPEGHWFESLTPGDERIGRLWEKASLLYPCSIVRDATTLPWKLSHKKYRFFGIGAGGELVAACACFYRREDKQWLICDLLGESMEALRLMITVACAQAWAFKISLDDEEERARVAKVAILATPLLQTVTAGLGFAKDKYDFPIAVQLLNPTVSTQEAKPEKWYVSAHD